MAWQTDDVTAMAAAPAAAFVLPASYVSEAGGTQHLIYLGFVDNHLHELWSDASGWHTDDLTAATGAPEPVPDHLVGYTFEAQGTQHVIYVGASDQHIHELWSDASGWHTDDLTAATGAPEPLPDHLVGYTFEAQGTQHVIYVGASDQHIHELWSDASGWHTDDLTAATGAPTAGGGPLVAFAFEAKRTQHVFYLDANMATPHVHELWSDASGWHTEDLTATTGAPPPTGWNLAGYAFEAQGTLHVFFTAGDRDSHIHELWSDSSGWHTDDMGVAPPSGGLAAYVSEAQGTQHLIYNAGSGAGNHMHELWWDSTGRHTTDLTAATGDSGGCAATVAYAFDANATRHVFDVGCRDHHVHELWWDTTGWHTDDLTAATGAPPVDTPTGVGLTGYAFAAQSTQHLFYVSDLDNHIHELWWGPQASAQQPRSSTATTSSSVPPSGPATASAAFVGHWHVHGGDLDITPTTATHETAAYQCKPGSQRVCREIDKLAVVAGDDKQLTLQVTAASYTDDTGASVPEPDLPAIGDSMRLDWQAPGLLKETILHGFPAWADPGGNPYWCGAGISQANLRLCGA